MKFVLGKSDRYWWPVVVRVPDPDRAGQTVDLKLEILLEPKDQDAAMEDTERLAGIVNIRERASAERAVLTDVCKDWRDVVDEDGKPVPFSTDALDAALQKSWFRIGLLRAYGESLSGEAARLGN